MQFGREILRILHHLCNTFFGMLCILTSHDHKEFIAAHAGHQVSSFESSVQHLREGGDQPISSLMSIGIIRFLQIIEINRDNLKGLLLGTKPTEFLLRPGTITDTGQGIGIGHAVPGLSLHLSQSLPVMSINVSNQHKDDKEGHAKGKNRNREIRVSTVEITLHIVTNHLDYAAEQKFRQAKTDDLVFRRHLLALLEIRHNNKQS